MTAPSLVLEGAQVGDTQRHTERLYPYLQRRQVSERREEGAPSPPPLEERSHHPVLARLPGEVCVVGGESPLSVLSPNPN